MSSENNYGFGDNANGYNFSVIKNSGFNSEVHQDQPGWLNDLSGLVANALADAPNGFGYQVSIMLPPSFDDWLFDQKKVVPLTIKNEVIQALLTELTPEQLSDQATAVAAIEALENDADPANLTNLLVQIVSSVFDNTEQFDPEEDESEV